MSRKPEPSPTQNAKLPPWVSKARLYWMVIKGMSVEDAVRMIGSKAVDLARDADSHDTPGSSDKGKAD